jgi:predicted MFS family arabinose efflux permease
VSLSWGFFPKFIVLGLLVAAIALLSLRYLPSVEGEKLTGSNSPFALLKMPSIWIILVLTFLAVTAHYGAYTYITLLVEDIQYPGGIRLALLIFGIGTILSLIVSGRVIDKYLRGLIVYRLALGAVAMALFVLFPGTPGLAHLAFFCWGLAFGPLVTMFQTAVSKQVESGKDVATSVQSSTFNFSIMVASYVGGRLLTQASVMSIVYLSLFLFIPAAVIALMAKRTLR